MNLKIILRRLLRFKLNPIVIILSLSIGLACINYISVFIFREFKTDRFHKDWKNIYSLTTNNPFAEGEKEYFCHIGAAEYVTQNFAEIEDYCSYRYSPCIKTKVNNNTFEDSPGVIKASSNFFDFLSYKLLTSNSDNPLESSNNIVISEELSKKYFGSESPLGKEIEIFDGGGNKKYVVSGIFQKPLQNSQLRFDMVFKIGENEDSPCFIKLSQGASKKEIETFLNKNRNFIPTLHAKSKTTFYLVSLAESYFTPLQRSKNENNRDPKDLYIALIIGLVILLIALINCLGLINNNLQNKRKEYAIRLINGSTKKELIREFSIENNIYIGLSFILSILLTMLGLPYFNELLNTQIFLKFILLPEQIILLLGLLLIISGITYSFSSIKIRSQIQSNLLLAAKPIRQEKYSFPFFNVLQITVTIVLIVFSTIVIKQIHYITEKPLGIDKDVIEIKIPWAHRLKVYAFRDELNSSSNIESSSIVSTSPVLDYALYQFVYTENGEEKTYSPACFVGDENYLTTLGIKVLEGEGFSQTGSNKNTCLINKEMANFFVGENLIGQNLPGTNFKVTGIVEDFHYENLKTMIEPAMISYSEEGNYLLAKPLKGHLTEAMADVSRVWSTVIPDYPVDIESINDRYNWLHRENKKFEKLITLSSLISILLSMMGLFAIAIDKSNKRIKEIGVRKVNGAKSSEVIFLLNQEFCLWVCIAFIIAVPIAWFFMNKWLENFAYRTSLSWWIFLLAGGITFLITLFTISWQSWRTAIRNPVEALRYE